MKKEKFTIEEHIQRGFALKLTSALLNSLIVELQEAYSLRHRSVKLAEAALRDINKLRAELDARLYNEYFSIANSTELTSYQGVDRRLDALRYPYNVLPLFERIRQDLIEEEPPSPDKGKGGQEKKTPKQ